MQTKITLFTFFSVVFLIVWVSCNRPSASDAEDTALSSTTTDTIHTSSGVHADVTDADIKQVAVWLHDSVLKDDLSFIKSEERFFSLDKYDLNGDGHYEYFVGFMNEYFCGSGGCTYYILNADGTVNSILTVSTAPFEVLVSKTNQWNDLVIRSTFGQHKLAFDGQSYPSNPSVLPVVQTDSLRKHQLVKDSLLLDPPAYSY